MGQKFIIKQSKNGLIQIPIEKYAEVSTEEIINTGSKMGIDWSKVSQTELIEGTIHEMKEHPKVVTDIAQGVQVALDHLLEIPDYYTRLKTIE